LEGMVQHFKIGCQQFSPLWKEIFSKEGFDEIQKTAKLSADQFAFSTDSWVRILYELAATFHTWSVNRYKLVELVTPLYYARVASFVRQTREMSSQDVETLVEEQAVRFEKQKDYLVQVWNQKSRNKLQLEV